MNDLEQKINELKVEIEISEARVSSLKEAIKTNQKKIKKLEEIKQQLTELYA